MRPFDVELVALLHVPLDDVGELRALRVPHDAAMPLRLLLLRPRRVVPRPAGGERKRGDAIATGRRAHLGIVPEVSDQRDLVQATAHEFLLARVLYLAAHGMIQSVLMRKQIHRASTLSVAHFTRHFTHPSTSACAVARWRPPRAADNTGVSAQLPRSRATDRADARDRSSRAPRGTPPLRREPAASLSAASSSAPSRSRFPTRSARPRDSRSLLRRRQTRPQHNQRPHVRHCARTRSTPTDAQALR